MKIRLIFAAALLAAACSPGFEVYDLRCEGLAEPLAIDSTQPHFSWKIRSGHAMEQGAWQIQAASTLAGLKDPDLWDSGRQASVDQVMVPWAGRALASREQGWWRVRVWTSDKDASAWSEPQRFGIGIILAAPVLFCWQGFFYLLAKLAAGSPLLQGTMVHELAIVGGVLIISSGFSLLKVKDCKTLNYLPALLVPVLWFLLKGLFT